VVVVGGSVVVEDVEVLTDVDGCDRLVALDDRRSSSPAQPAPTSTTPVTIAHAPADQRTRSFADRFDCRATGENLGDRGTTSRSAVDADPEGDRIRVRD
jgi:hypothetical protein